MRIILRLDEARALDREGATLYQLRLDMIHERPMTAGAAAQTLLLASDSSPEKSAKRLRALADLRDGGAK